MPTKKKTEADTRKSGIFGNKLDYEMFCLYWNHLCGRLNPKRGNGTEV